MAQEFYDLNGPQPGPRRHDGPIHPQQASMGGFPQGHSAVPPAPPRNMIPVDLRGGPAVLISDISRDLFSESDMKEEITDYMVFRFEKMADKDEFDDHGRPKWPSWEKAIRTEDRSISKQMAAKKVRQLNRTTRDAPDKKNSLPSALKRQIDSTLEFLTSREPDLINFHWVLAQIDHQLRTIQPYYSNLSYHSIPARKHRSPTAYHFPSKKRSYSGSGSRHTKKAYERISLTAYFQRVPRQGVDVARLWKEKRRGLDGMYHPHPGGVHNVVPQMQPNHTQFQGQQNANRGQGPPPTQMPNRNPQGPQVPPQNRPMNQGAHQQHNGGQGHRQNGKKGGRHSDSETDSGNESHSSRSSSSTGPSSVSDHRGGGHHNNRHHVGNSANHIHNHLPRHERPAGVHKANGSPRLARTSLSPRRSPRAPAPPYPLSRDDGSVASNIERIREEAYQRGRLAERTDARLAEELAFSKTHARPRPHVIQEHSPPPARVYRARTDEDDIPRYFNRLSLLDDEEDDVEFRREEARRLREYERRVQHGSILEEDPFEGSQSPSSYTYSTDGRGRGRRRMPQIVEIPHLLNPRPRRRMLYD